MPTVVFVHGACVGEDRGDLYDDVDACLGTIASVEGPVVLCGHSNGGVVITEACGHDRYHLFLSKPQAFADSIAREIAAASSGWIS